MAPVAQDILPQHPRFQLNASGLAGFFGGDEAIAAMNTAQYYQGRRFLGFYNSPGSFRMAKHYGRLAKSRIWRGFYPDASLEPHEVFNLDGGPGGMCPDFLGAKTGVLMNRTGHLGYLFFKKMRHGVNFTPVYSTPNRRTKPVRVTIVRLTKLPEDEIKSSEDETKSPEDETVSSEDETKSSEDGPYPTSKSLRLDVLWFNTIAVLASLAACIISGLSKDWYAFSLILLGIVANGVACLVLGSGKITVSFPNTLQVEGAPPGDGLMTMGDDIVIVIGEERQTSRITRGSISVEFPAWVKWNDYFVVGACCLLLMLQLLVQLFLIPQATLFGQILFLCSFGVSFLCNTYLSAIDKGDLQREILENRVWNVGKGAAKGYEFQNWTTMAMAMLYVLRPPRGGAEKQFLNRLLPNQTPGWKAFKKDVLVAYREELPVDPKQGETSRGPPPTEKDPLVLNMYTDWDNAVRFVNDHIPRPKPVKVKTHISCSVCRGHFDAVGWQNRHGRQSPHYAVSSLHNCCTVVRASTGV